MIGLMTSGSWVARMATVCLCCFASGASAANIVMNGNFSTGTPTAIIANNPSGLNPTGKDTLPAGWSTNQATDSYINVVASGSVINGVASPIDPMGSAFYMAFQSS